MLMCIKNHRSNTERLIMTPNRMRKKHIQLPKGIVVQNKTRDRGLADYIIQTTPEEKAQFYEEVYQLFMSRLKEADPSRYDIFKDMESELNAQEGMGMVAFMFKRVAPTFCDLAPVNLLRKALIMASTIAHFDMLCTFMQIAAFRWALIEKSFKSTAVRREGRLAHSWALSEEARPFIEIFETMLKENQDFHTGYVNLIIPMLIENENELKRLCREIAKNRRGTKSESSIKKINNQIIDAYAEEPIDKEKIKESVLQIEPLERKIRDRYRRWREQRNEKRVMYFKSINCPFFLSELEETLWKKLPPWPIDICLKNYDVELNAVEYAVFKDSISLSEE